MRVMIVHNDYGKFSGEEAVVEAQKDLLLAHGHEVIEFRRRSADIETQRFGKVKAFFSGISNPSARREIQRCIADSRPDIVHVHNVFPLISPSVLPECRGAGLPVVMSVHNYRLICPNGLHMPKGKPEICERCSGGKEYWCLLRNCERSISKSLGYFLRNHWARTRRLFKDNVTLFACLTDFQRQRLISAGYPSERLCLLPNMMPPPSRAPNETVGSYVGFAGRRSPEKGVACLLEAARKVSDIPVRLAGGSAPGFKTPHDVPPNVTFLGPLEPSRMGAFYEQCRLMVLPSVWFEGFPLVLLEAMQYGKPIVASRLGGIPEIVDDGVTGLLVEAGDAEALGDAIRYLWDRPDLCRRMGQAGMEKLRREYSAERYYERLMEIYDKAVRQVSASGQ